MPPSSSPSSSSTPTRAPSSSPDAPRPFSLGTLDVLAPIITGALLVFALYAVFVLAPTEREMGIVQRIFYFHVPSAIAMGGLFVVCGVASLVYLINPDRRLDAVAASAAEVAVMLGTVVLITGPLWARKAWGAYWTWEARLTLTLLTFFIYLGYLAIRAYGGPPEISRRAAAILGVAGLPAYYFIKVAVEKWGGNHPKNVVYGEGGGLIQPDMRLAFFAALAAVFAMALTLVWLRTRVHLLQERLLEAKRDIAEYNLLGTSEEM